MNPMSIPMISAITEARAMPLICIWKINTNVKLKIILVILVAITILRGTEAFCSPINHPINEKFMSVAGIPQILI